MPARGAGCRTSLLYVSIARLENIPQRASSASASKRGLAHVLSAGAVPCGRDGDGKPGGTTRGIQCSIQIPDRFSEVGQVLVLIAER